MPSCKRCKEPTRYPIGFWDSYSRLFNRPKHGFFYECSNLKCPKKIERMMSIAQGNAKKEAAIKKNISHGIDFSRVEAYRRKSGLLIMEMCRLLEIRSAALYCSYRNYQEAVPMDIWEKCLEVIK